MKRILSVLLITVCATTAPAFAASINSESAPQFGDFVPGTGGDLFSIDAGSFGVTGPVSFQSGIFGNPGISNIGADDPSAIGSDVNVVVIQNHDNNDLNSLVPATWDASWNARTALQAIAANTTGDRAGFFVYWNEGLGVNRLFAAENLNDGNSALKLLFTIASDTLTGVPGDFDLNLSDGFAQTNLFGEANSNLFELAEFNDTNFNFVAAVPLPATFPALLAAFGALGWVARRRS